MSPVDEKRTSVSLHRNALAMDHPPPSPNPTHYPSNPPTLHEPESSDPFRFPQNPFPAVHTSDNDIPSSPLSFHQISRSTIGNQKLGSNETIAFYSDASRLNLNVEPQETRTSAMKAGLTLKELAAWLGHIVSTWWMAERSPRAKVFIKICIASWVLGGVILSCMAITQLANSRANKASH
ncbi:hypothetical protein B0O99DRAFT_693670 [Bisporella sp. PMI_857]|nr:hypothetical protein B0O99DRAFT_693670 [Bisporella sp. PMI_857]